MNPSKEQELQIDNYLSKLRESLSDRSVADREEIVREISVHIRECAQQPNSSIDGILKRLGSAESLASQYGNDLLIRQASRSISPVLILRATIELAKRGIEGMVLFLGALLGYALGAGFVVTAILKPIFPHQTGLWIGPGVLDFGFHEQRPSDPVHEVLGWWYIPIALCLGCFFLWLTTYGIRWFLSRSKQRGPLFARSHLKSIIPIFLFCLLATACFAQNKKDDKPKPAQSIEDLRQQLEKILKDTHTPGMSVAIVHRDGPEWIAGLGTADVASDRATTSETLFRIGSTSKAFASLSILKLANEGKLLLEDPMHKLVPEVWFENRWEASDPVRVVDLLEHTTGWDDMHLREYAKDAPATMGLREALDYDHHSRISRWRPGTRMAYCNSGPAVAAYIVEKISGQRFEDYVTQNFFAPIGMKTATYFEPTSAPATTLYHPDGKTPYPYWNILYRPVGSINASANSMAAYVLFYLNRGTVNGAQVMPVDSINRMEVPTRTWAAKAGLNNGYGLSDYWSIHEGFVYHGHNGGVEGGLTEMAYLPDYGVGYFFSINTGNGDAFDRIGKAIRSYVTRELQRPSLPAVVPLPPSAAEYAGWYEPDSPRVELTHFVERLAGISRVRFQDSKLSLTYLGGWNETFLPVAGTLFRYVPKKDPPEPVSALELLTRNEEGQFLQAGTMTTMKRVPAWLAILEIVLAVFVLLSIASILVYAPFWILGGLSKKRRRPAERGMRVWPLFAVLSLVAVVVIFILASDDLMSRMGNLTGWSAALFLATVFYAVASVASAVVLWRAPKQEVRSRVRRYSMAVTLALLIAAAYLSYWGIIGLRTWA
jgi:CubicO group peptidase (beta-lactamase class C family)